MEGVLDVLEGDRLAHEPVEVEAALARVAAFARETGVATPTLDVVLPLMRGLDRSLRLG